MTPGRGSAPPKAGKGKKKGGPRLEKDEQPETPEAQPEA